MKILDLSPLRIEGSLVDKIKNQITGVNRYGWAWLVDMQAQDVVVQHFSRILNKNYTLIRNVILPGMDAPIPLILVGVTGVYLIHVSGARGMFRARAEAWGALNKSTGKFQVIQNSPITRTLKMTRVVENYLTHFERPHPDIQPVLAFTQPGTHVETQHPAVRVILRDALDRLAGSFLQSPVLLSIEEVQKIVDLIGEQRPIPQVAPEPDAAEMIAALRPTEPERPAGLPIWLKLTFRQWLLLGGLLVVWVVVIAIALSLFLNAG